MNISRGRPLKDASAEAALFGARALQGFCMIAACLLLLGGWYFRMQVLDYEQYKSKAEANRIKLRPIVPARGLIFDRNGKLLADNVQAWRIEVTPDDVPDLKDTLARLGTIIPLSDDDLASFDKLRRASRGFRAVPLKLGLGEAEVARFAIDRHLFPGVDVAPYLTRRYPCGDLFAHVLGYVGRVDADDIARLGDSRYAVLSQVGKSGLERYYEDRLRGQIGYEQVEANVEGRPLRVLGRIPARPGSDLRLSIDAGLQRTLVEAFGHYDGAAVVVDPRNGEVLAMASLPAFDPNGFVNGISHADYDALVENISRPLFNRVLVGGTLPGSTIKPFVALAGLESGVRRADDRIFSTGEFHIPGQKRGYRDAEAGGAGWVDLRRSIALSVNTYYYKLAMDMGIERFDDYMRRYGFGAKTGIDLSGESIGVIPSPEWKRERFPKSPDWFLGETIIAGIGQGYWIVTPLQLAQGVSALAADGVRHPLHLVRETRDGFTAPWVAMPLAAATSFGASPEHLAAVRDGMIQVTQIGTAKAIGEHAQYLIAGKTGTAQRVGRKGNISLDPRALPVNLRHQSLFIAYAPANAPTIAIAVVVEHGGYGATAAAPIAKTVLDAWLLKRSPEQVANDLAHAKPAAAPDAPDDDVPAEDPSP
ncbi:MAG TPA: penicillin-binding protein 2 [Xanthomonadaceae bacterium]